jgi:hypothetical protein
MSQFRHEEPRSSAHVTTGLPEARGPDLIAFMNFLFEKLCFY